jgi:glycosyltransferase involved in cell wall biosynthesis
MITFIIPTIGRKTLQRTIESIENQTNAYWNAIVVFDGIEPTLTTTNQKIRVIKSKKLGQGKNSAGNVRNYGMNFVTTEWIAFVDDDDVVSPDFVETFNDEIQKHPDIDVVIFRMYRHLFNDVVPRLKTTNFVKSQVGISFVVKTDIFKAGFKFTPSKNEDYNYLDDLRKNKFRIMISPHIKYFVDGDVNPNLNQIRGNRVLVHTHVKNQISTPSIRTVHVLFLISVICVVVLVLVGCVVKQN